MMRRLILSIVLCLLLTNPGQARWCYDIDRHVRDLIESAIHRDRAIAIYQWQTPDNASIIYLLDLAWLDRIHFARFKSSGCIQLILERGGWVIPMNTKTLWNLMNSRLLYYRARGREM